MSAIKEAIELVNNDNSARTSLLEHVAKETGMQSVTEADAAQYLSSMTFSNAMSGDDIIAIAMKLAESAK
jgi:hypothetical protein